MENQERKLKAIKELRRIQSIYLNFACRIGEAIEDMDDYTDAESLSCFIAMMTCQQGSCHKLYGDLGTLEMVAWDRLMGAVCGEEVTE